MYISRGSPSILSTKRRYQFIKKMPDQGVRPRTGDGVGVELRISSTVLMAFTKLREAI